MNVIKLDVDPWPYINIVLKYGVNMRTKKAEAKRKLILDSAILIFAEKGYHYATIEAIAQEAGIAKGSIHAYFENKLDLLLSILLDFWRQANSSIMTVVRLTP